MNIFQNIVSFDFLISIFPQYLKQYPSLADVPNPFLVTEF